MADVTVSVVESPVTVVSAEQNVDISVNEQTVVVALGTSGPQGPRGASVLSGNGAPSFSFGDIGDHYIDKLTQELYGPKTSSGWGTPVDLVTNQELGYVHVQSAPSTTWTINHDLGFIPNITVVDSAGTVIEGSYNYANETTVVLTFAGAFSGKAYLS